MKNKRLELTFRPYVEIIIVHFGPLPKPLAEKRVKVSKETVVLRRWG